VAIGVRSFARAARIALIPIYGYLRHRLHRVQRQGEFHESGDFVDWSVSWHAAVGHFLSNLWKFGLLTVRSLIWLTEDIQVPDCCS